MKKALEIRRITGAELTKLVETLNRLEELVTVVQRRGIDFRTISLSRREGGQAAAAFPHRGGWSGTLLRNQLSSVMSICKRLKPARRPLKKPRSTQLGGRRLPLTPKPAKFTGSDCRKIRNCTR